MSSPASPRSNTSAPISLLPFKHQCAATSLPRRCAATLTIGKPSQVNMEEATSSQMHTDEVHLEERGLSATEQTFYANHHLLSYKTDMKHRAYMYAVELLERFSKAERIAKAPRFTRFTDENGIPLSWLVDLFSVEFMPVNANEETITIYLEAYLLWLFGSTMFSHHSSKVQTWILPYAFSLANSPTGSIPKFSWGSAVLAATYRGLSNVCTSKAKEPVLTGSPMLVQLWSYARFKVGRPRPTGDVEVYHRNEDDETDGPTLGSKWLTPVEIPTKVISHMDYYKNKPETTVQEFKTVFDYLSEKCKTAIDHDAMPTPAPIRQLRATYSDTSEHLEVEGGQDDRDLWLTPMRHSGTSDDLEVGDDSEHVENAEMQGEGSENLENVLENVQRATTPPIAPPRRSSRLQKSPPQTPKNTRATKAAAIAKAAPALEKQKPKTRKGGAGPAKAAAKAQAASALEKQKPTRKGGAGAPQKGQKRQRKQ
ncbi:hypothetical protein D1007_47245 [Hordeum vulgare]|nr:hypothetical protein D1007_47245 [Hordeum vulgare]